MAAPTVDDNGRATADTGTPAGKAAGGVATWWYDWVDRHRVGGQRCSSA